MSTIPINDASISPSISGAESVAPPRRTQTRPVASRADLSGEVDAVQALLDLAEQLHAPAAPSLADQLLDFLAPHPRNPNTLTQSRIVPLLGLAADLIGRAATDRNDIVTLGSTALEQELRMQRALADRRATLIDI